MVEPTPDIKPFIVVQLPLPPSVNESYCVIRSHVRGALVARIGPSKQLKQFKQDAATILARRSELVEIDWKVVQSILESKKKVPLQAKITFYFKTPWRSDVDGRIKQAIDAVFNAVNLNDNLLVEVNAKKAVNVFNPHCHIEISCKA